MKLLEPLRLGGLELRNRMVMAPMTRSRANLDGVVGDSTVTYYTQRATAGLIISEAINISIEAIGSPFTPGLYTKEQVNAWKKVTQAVHRSGGIMYAQLWHTGRVGHSLVKKGDLPVAPSAIGIQGQKHFTSEGMKEYETPRALTVEDIKRVVVHYRNAAVNAMEAGFDGVEVHAAFGYLPDQFLAESANHRQDAYGGSMKNRNRFILEVMSELVDAIGEHNVAVRLSPTSTYNNIAHLQPLEQFTALIKELNNFRLSYLHLMKIPFSADLFPHYPADAVDVFGRLSDHPVVANCGYTRESGEAELQKGIAQLISFGTLFLANPDLPKRFESNSELNQPDRATMYGGNDQGYIDYPFLNQ